MSQSRVVIVDEQTTFSTTPPPPQEYPARAMVNKDNS